MPRRGGRGARRRRRTASPTARTRSWSCAPAAARFRKLSISRDTLAEIPGHDNQKINAAYAFGGAKLTIETVENFLGIDIDQVAIVDFGGFRDFIDAIGGITVDLDEPVCCEISGGAENGGITLDLGRARTTSTATRRWRWPARASSDCDGDGNADAEIPDLDRVRFQQEVISGIKGKLTDPARAAPQLPPRAADRLERAQGPRHRAWAP